MADTSRDLWSVEYLAIQQFAGLSCCARLARWRPAMFDTQSRSLTLNIVSWRRYHRAYRCLRETRASAISRSINRQVSGANSERFDICYTNEIIYCALVSHKYETLAQNNCNSHKLWRIVHDYNFYSSRYNISPVTYGMWIRNIFQLNIFWKYIYLTNILSAQKVSGIVYLNKANRNRNFFLPLYSYNIRLSCAESISFSTVYQLVCLQPRQHRYPMDILGTSKDVLRT